MILLWVQMQKDWESRRESRPSAIRSSSYSKITSPIGSTLVEGASGNCYWHCHHSNLSPGRWLNRFRWRGTLESQGSIHSYKKCSLEVNLKNWREIQIFGKSKLNFLIIFFRDFGRNSSVRDFRISFKSKYLHSGCGTSATAAAATASSSIDNPGPSIGRFVSYSSRSCSSSSKLVNASQ